MPEHRTPRPADDAPPLPPLADEEEAGDTAGDLGELVDDLEEGAPSDDPLDDRSGADDEIEGLEGDLGSEDGWIEDSDADDSVGEDDSTEEGDEYGWTDDSESTGTDDWEDELLPNDEPAAEDSDSGDEGSDEPDVDGAVDLELGPLEESSDEDDDFEEMDSVGGDPQDDDEEAWSAPAAADPASVLVRHIGPSDEALVDIAVWKGALYAAGGDAFGGDEEHIALIDDPALEGIEVESVALVPLPEGAAVALGSVLGGCLVRRPGRTTFEPANGWLEGARRPSFHVIRSGSALLGRSGEGDLYRSVDCAATWKRLDLGGRCLAAAGEGDLLLALATPIGGEDVVLCRSEDAGQTFERVVMPLVGLVPGTDVVLSSARHEVLVVAEGLSGPLYSSDGGRTFETWSRPGAVAAALDPRAAGTAYLCLFHAANDEGLLVRTRDAGKTFETLFELGQLRRVFRLTEQGDPDGDNRISAVVPDPDEAGRIYVATAAGAFVVALRGS